jgi:cobalamin biosynthesis protein CbiG
VIAVLRILIALIAVIALTRGPAAAQRFTHEIACTLTSTVHTFDGLTRDGKLVCP